MEKMVRAPQALRVNRMGSWVRFFNCQDKEKRPSMSFQVSEDGLHGFSVAQCFLLLLYFPVWSSQTTKKIWLPGRAEQRPINPFFTPRWLLKAALEVLPFILPYVIVLLHAGPQRPVPTIMGTSPGVLQSLRTSIPSLMAEEGSIKVCTEYSPKPHRPLASPCSLKSCHF